MSEILISREEIRAAVRQFLFSEVLSGEDPESILDTTPLITGGFLDSIATVNLVVFLEETFKVVIEQREVTIINLDTIALLVGFVENKLHAMQAVK